MLSSTMRDILDIWSKTKMEPDNEDNIQKNHNIYSGDESIDQEDDDDVLGVNESDNRDSDGRELRECRTVCGRTGSPPSCTNADQNHDDDDDGASAEYQNVSLVAF